METVLGPGPVAARGDGEFSGKVDELGVPEDEGEDEGEDEKEDEGEE